MIKAIVFDFFGVLVTEGLTTFTQAFLAKNPVKKAEASKLVDEYNTSVVAIEYSEFLNRLALIVDVTVDTVSQYLDHEQPNIELLEFISELKNNFKLAVLSNAGSDWVREILRPGDLALFDEILMSFEYKMIKPDANFYRLAAQKLEVSPQECIFVDDITRYCDGAEAVGMKSIQFKNTQQFKQDLGRVLADSNN